MRRACKTEWQEFQPIKLEGADSRTLRVALYAQGGAVDSPNMAKFKDVHVVHVTCECVEAGSL
jgi:hypothetical protein